jgi:hypothetical protein
MRTDAQNEALIQVRDILTEHFESAVLIISTEVEDKQDALDIFWHGGFASALGLLDFGRDEIKLRQKDKYESS